MCCRESQEIVNGAFKLESLVKLLGVIIESESNEFGNQQIIQAHLIDSISCEIQSILSLTLKE